MVMDDRLCADHPGGWNTCSSGQGGAAIPSAASEGSRRKGRRQDTTDLWSKRSTFDKEREEEEAVSVETNGHFPLVYVWALKDWVANWGWNVFSLMDQITSHVFIFGCVKVIIQDLCQQHWCTLSVLQYWLMSGLMGNRPCLDSVWLRCCSWFLLCSPLATQMGA